jgi:hypothetical protein
LRESDGIGLEDCLSIGKSHPKELRKAEVLDSVKNSRAQFRRAEEIDEGMALKI